VRLFALWLAVCACSGQASPAQPQPDDALRVSRLQVAASGLFSKLPNITCSLAIERSRRPKADRKFELLDNLHLEVGFIDGKELYAWPGSRRFDDRELFDLVGPIAGAIGNGDFAIHAKSIILSGLATLGFDGEETAAGRRMDRWNFRQPIATSRHGVRIPPAEAMVGYSGTLWADSSNGDLVRIEMKINEIPPQLPLKAGFKTITYERVPLAESSFLLPKTSELILVEPSGSESRNRTSFTGCRLYTAESTLNFEDLPASAAPQPARSAALPSGIELHLRPVAPVDFPLLSVGDPVQFTVDRDAVSDGQVRLPAGALVNGRVMSLECRNIPVQYCLAFLRLESFKAGGIEGEIRAVLQLPSISEQMAPAYRELDKSGKLRGSFGLSIVERPGMSPVFVHNKRWKASDTTVWRTR